MKNFDSPFIAFLCTSRPIKWGRFTFSRSVSAVVFGREIPCLGHGITITESVGALRRQELPLEQSFLCAKCNQRRKGHPFKVRTSNPQLLYSCSSFNYVFLGRPKPVDRKTEQQLYLCNAKYTHFANGKC